MEDENVLTSYIKDQLNQEEGNYNRALSAGKPICEVKRIQDRIHYLKSLYRHIRDRYPNSSENDLFVPE